MRHIILYWGIGNEEHSWTRWVYRIMNLTLVSAGIFSVKPCNWTSVMHNFSVYGVISIGYISCLLLYMHLWISFLCLGMLLRVYEMQVQNLNLSLSFNWPVNCQSLLTRRCISASEASNPYGWAFYLQLDFFSAIRIGSALISHQEFIVCCFSLSAF